MDHELLDSHRRVLAVEMRRIRSLLGWLEETGVPPEEVTLIIVVDLRGEVARWVAAHALGEALVQRRILGTRDGEVPTMSIPVSPGHVALGFLVPEFVAVSFTAPPKTIPTLVIDEHDLPALTFLSRDFEEPS